MKKVEKKFLREKREKLALDEIYRKFNFFFLLFRRMKIREE